MIPSELILILYVIGLSIFLLVSIKHLLYKYGILNAFKFGVSWALIYFGGILMVIGSLNVLFFAQTTNSLSIFALGFAITGFGINIGSTFEHNRKTDEILRRLTNESSTITYKNQFTYNDKLIFCSVGIVWFGPVTMLTLNPSHIYLGLGSGWMLIFFTIWLMGILVFERPKAVNEKLCQTVIQQIQSKEE